MARILIGNIKGPAGKIVSVSATKGEPGTDPQVTNVGTESDAKLQFVIPEGQKGEQGLQGPTGPMPPLVNNLTTNQAGQGALDAAQGKALADKDTALQSAVDALNRKTNISIYNTLASLSLESGCSVIDVINALPNDSIFIRGNQYSDNNISGNMPPDYMNGGTLFISKVNTRLIIKYQRQNANSVLEPPTEYIGSTENGNPTTLKWFSATLTEAS